jgi:cytoskeletal protein RodZ
MNEETQLVPLGEKLKTARTSKKISLAEAAQATRIRSTYIDALENNRWQEFPAEVYLLGFLKKYGQFLDLSPENLVELYAEEKGGVNRSDTPAPVVEIRKAVKRPWQVRPAFLAAAAVTAVVALLAISRQGNDFLPSPSRSKPGAAGIPEHVLSATALRDAWVNVSTNGRRLFKGVIPAANIRIWRSRFPFQIEIRKAADVQVEIDDAPVNLTGQEGRKTELPGKP